MTRVNARAVDADEHGMAVEGGDGAHRRVGHAGQTGACHLLPMARVIDSHALMVGAEPYPRRGLVIVRRLHEQASDRPVASRDRPICHPHAAVSGDEHPAPETRDVCDELVAEEPSLATAGIDAQHTAVECHPLGAVAVDIDLVKNDSRAEQRGEIEIGPEPVEGSVV